MKNILFTSRDWYGHKLALPEKLLPVPKLVAHKRSIPYTYHQNVCTVSYSMWSWGWKEWEKHIDWMAMNGINLPLAFTGQEIVWQKLFVDHFKVSTEGMQNFMAGAGFLAWGRMGNIQGGWTKGPLLQTFVEAQYKLQIKILSRLREYGMTPVMPGTISIRMKCNSICIAFAGHVPAQMTQLYPAGNFTKSAKWCNFPDKNCCVYSVEPTDDLFHEIGKKFIQVLRETYVNSSSVYQCDTYNEMVPRSFDAEYLASSSKAVYESINAADKHGVWLMQGWLFFQGENSVWTNDKVEAYLSGVPDKRLVVLDLYSDARPQWKRTHNFFGKLWIYCVLHNFGGNLGIRGDLPTIASAPYIAMSESKDTLIGIGITMEGMYQNYVVYDLTLETAWNHEPVNLSSWITQYTQRRYHFKDQQAVIAWNTLSNTLYNCSHEIGGVTKSIVTLRPHFRMSHSGFMPTMLTYDPSNVPKILHNILNTSPELHHVDIFQYDVVDLTRQLLSDVFLGHHHSIIKTYSLQTSTAEQVCAQANAMLQILDDLDIALSSNVHFLLGRWIQDAKNLNTSSIEVEYYEFQARNQITRWGADNKNALNDYAGKQWGGLVRGYYKKRWEIFLNELCQSKKHHKDFNEAQVTHDLETFEVTWQVGNENYPSEPHGDSVLIASTLLRKYESYWINS